MENYGAMIRATFEMGSVRDAEMLFEACVKNAFPTKSYRKLELIRFLRDTPYMEGRSWNHVFEVKSATLDNFPVWEVRARRVTSGVTPERVAYLDHLTLNFIQYEQ